MRSEEGNGKGIIGGSPDLEVSQRHWVIVNGVSSVWLYFKGAAQGVYLKASEGVGKFGVEVRMVLGLGMGRSWARIRGF